jgi:hypothetical protein
MQLLTNNMLAHLLFITLAHANQSNITVIDSVFVNEAKATEKNANIKCWLV